MKVDSRVFKLGNRKDGGAIYGDGKHCEQTCVARQEVHILDMLS